MVEEAETVPLIAWSGPVNPASVRVVTLRLVVEAFVAKKFVVVAEVKRVLPKSVVEERRFEDSELKAPVTVEEPVTAKAVVVPFWSENACPVMSPVLERLKSVVVEKRPPELVVLEIWKREVFVDDALARRPRVAKGVLVPIPTDPWW